MTLKDAVKRREVWLCWFKEVLPPIAGMIFTVWFLTTRGGPKMIEIVVPAILVLGVFGFFFAKWRVEQRFEKHD
ncbi:hypothetical protein [Tropicibacter sp. Alg240-R139]|uniref:hypothetical protein n=1 Tax=Tropicibacter sp. Alg240-R139 TaxID=2305991 RepID=UPI0013DF80D3|nr:hypothetical protein [Tropicibacter sp. Alg240-R139]